MRFYRRKRFWGVWGIAAVVCVPLFLLDPDSGASFVVMILGLFAGSLAVAAAHVWRKFLLDYPEADLRTLFDQAQKGNQAAGMAIIGIAIIFVGLLVIFAPRVHAADIHTYVPKNALVYLPTLKQELRTTWASHPKPSIMPALIEQESCISLTHSRCWSPTSRLKTSREEGAGLGQITRAYNKDGSIRFDTLEAVKSLDPALAALTWNNVYTRPDLQMRALVVMNKDCYRKLRIVSGPVERLSFCDAAYNGGYGGMQSERRACGLVEGCDPQQWFGHVEKHCLKSKVKWQGYGLSACDINRDHVEKVLLIRSPKYAPLMEAL